MGGGRREEQLAVYPYDYFVILVLKQRQLGTEHVHYVLVLNGVTYKKPFWITCKITALLLTAYDRLLLLKVLMNMFCQ